MWGERDPPPGCPAPGPQSRPPGHGGFAFGQYKAALLLQEHLYSDSHQTRSEDTPQEQRWQSLSP